MTTYWFSLASRSEFTVRACLNSAMFGPIDTSYQLLNHSSGTHQPIESSYRPPAFHAGDRKCAVSGKRVSVRVDLAGSRILTTTTISLHIHTHGKSLTQGKHVLLAN